jgi:hypothetical protein
MIHMVKTTLLAFDPIIPLWSLLILLSLLSASLARNHLINFSHIGDPLLDLCVDLCSRWW